MQLGIVGLGRLGGAMAYRRATTRKHFVHRAVESRDAKL